MNEEKECIDCPEHDYCRDSKLSWVLFAIALIATIAMRIIEPLKLINSSYGKIAWYTGVIGFFIFFSYKTSIDQKRAENITRTDLSSKIRAGKTLDKSDYETLDSILCSLTSKKDRINFMFIAVFSLVALFIVVYFDIFG